MKLASLRGAGSNSNNMVRNFGGLKGGYKPPSYFWFAEMATCKVDESPIIVKKEAPFRNEANENSYAPLRAIQERYCAIKCRNNPVS